MRVALLTTVAAAALSLSVAAIAQTSGGSGGSTGGTSGGMSGGASGGASGGTTVVPQSGGTSGPTTGSSGTSGGASSGTSAGTSSGTSGTASGGTTSGTTSGAAGTRTGGAASTTGSTSSSTNINVTNEQRTEITRAFSSVRTQPLNDVNFSVSVGTVIPETVVTRLEACPNEVIRILHGLPECRYVIVRDQVVIVEPKTRRIVTVIERRG
ncbi:DUF1236 domain-containing protein [Microvirga sp. G4-2]|uniref:DUF1236 domain-containing protein n=1 Tax=Microvirga sp. G4-2 TaxID=3434467 RepID=UPI0040449A87